MKQLENMYTPPAYDGRRIAFKYDIEVDLSIIIPVYNGAKFLNKCVDSILHQRGTEDYRYEIILVDDGSSDNSYEICLDYQNRYPQIITSVRKENGGQASARNYGVSLSRGEYLAFIDDDDYIETNLVECTMAVAREQNSEVVKFGRKEKKDEKTRRYPPVDSRHKHVTKAMISNLSGFVWENIIHRSIFSKICFPEGFWYEDMITKLLIYRMANRISIVEDCLYNYCFHDSNTSHVLWNTNNYKCLDQLYLPMQLMEYACNDLKLMPDQASDAILSKEWGELLYIRTRKLKWWVRRETFRRASEYATKYIKDPASIQGFGKKNIDCLLKRNFFKWTFINFIHRYIGKL